MRFLIAIVVYTLLACASSTPKPTQQAAQSVRLSAELEVREIAPGIAVHTTWKELPEVGLFPSNGLIVLGATEALLIDTAWTEEATVLLFDYVEHAYKRRVTHVIVTHSHDDRAIGIREAMRRNARVHALSLTATRTAAAGLGSPTDTFEESAVIEFDGIRAEAYFPGPAHAPDNLVVWLPHSRILVGGCMVRSAADTAPGNLADASLATWVDSVRAVQRRFPDIAVVIPGHGAPGTSSLLDHTIELVRATEAP
jgi:glyoxylase-like metal-dependent hydrolase (beta-lactamase superfamily II)